MAIPAMKTACTTGRGKVKVCVKGRFVTPSLLGKKYASKPCLVFETTLQEDRYWVFVHRGENSDVAVLRTLGRFEYWQRQRTGKQVHPCCFLARTFVLVGGSVL